MNTIRGFLLGIGLTVGISGAAVLYLRRSLLPLLTELCGSEERARFWLAFSNVSLLLMPLIIALHSRPEPDNSLVFELGAQVAQALGGLLTTLVVLGFVVGSFVARTRPPASTSAPPVR